MSLENDNKNIIPHKKKKKNVKEDFEAHSNGRKSDSSQQCNTHHENQSTADNKKKKTKKCVTFSTSVSSSENNEAESFLTVNNGNDANSLNYQKEKKRNRKHKKHKKIKPSNSVDENSKNSKTIPSREERAVSYLETWKNNRGNWKFEKLTQFWLLKNMFSNEKVSKESFKILLEYLTDLKGFTRNFATEACEGIIKKMEENSSLNVEDKSLKIAYKRAKSVRQCLQ